MVPDIIPDKPEENGWKLHQVYDTRSPGVYEFSVDQPTWVRVTVVGKSADGTKGETGEQHCSSTDSSKAGRGGDGGASGGIARRSILLMPEEPVTVTINSSLVSFGQYLTARAASGRTGVGTVSGGEDFNLNGLPGGTGGSGGSYSSYYPDKKSSPGSPGSCSAGGSGGPGGSGGVTGGGGGYGGGAQIPMPYEGYNQQPKYTTPNNGAFSVTETDVTVSGGGRGGSGGPAA